MIHPAVTETRDRDVFATLEWERTQHRIATRRGVVDEHELIGIAAHRPGDAPCRDAHAGCGRLTDRCVIGELPQQILRWLTLDLVLNAAPMLDHRDRRCPHGAVIEIDDLRI